MYNDILEYYCNDGGAFYCHIEQVFANGKLVSGLYNGNKQQRISMAVTYCLMKKINIH